MSTIGELKLAVSGFMQRDPQTFVRGTAPNSFDLLLQACNNARLYAERKIDFELSKKQVTFPAVSLVDGTTLSTAVEFGTVTPVSVKKILVPYIALSDSGTMPLDLWPKRKWVERLKRRFDGAQPTDTSEYGQDFTLPYTVVQDGEHIFMSPANSTTLAPTFELYADVIRWLTPYTTDDQTDFLLDYAFDWLMYRCVYELNFYLKEDERVMLSDKLMNDSWGAMVTWNNELVNANTDDSDLT